MSLYIGVHEIPRAALSALVKRSYSSFASQHVTPLVDVRLLLKGVRERERNLKFAMLVLHIANPNSPHTLFPSACS